MQFDDNTVEFLVASESFQAHCLRPTAQSREMWEHWAAERPGAIANMEEASRLILALAGHLSDEELRDSTRALERISTQKQRSVKRNVFVSSRLWVGMAATALVLVSVWLWWTPEKVDPIVTVATAFGETREIGLPDGSTLTLNANSDVTYKQSWEGEPLREIWLEGEAYLEVVKSPERPFIVHTHEADIKVLGTSFNVIQRKDQCIVTLLEGKVEVDANENGTAILQPGDQARLTSEGVTVEAIDPAQFIAWKDHTLVFHGQSIQYIVDRLAWEFDIEVEVTNKKLLEKRVTAVLQTNDPALLLEALAAIYDLTIRNVGDRRYMIE
ncbi:MAG: FecR domain-containing protein [Bacteroidia bacterium]|nr:FecR domain-containing protein [Bacteroidia bacterium]